MKIYYIEYQNTIKFFNGDMALEIEKREEVREISKSSI